MLNKRVTNYYCPITGLKVFTRPEWVNQKVSDTFTANFYIIGNAIIYSLPIGKADLEGVKKSLALNAEVEKFVLSATGPCIQIEDYARMDGSTQAARNYFIDTMNANKRRQSLIFCNLSLPSNIAVKIGNRFTSAYKDIHVAKHYKDSIIQAMELCDSKNLGQKFWAFDQGFCFDRSEPSLAPIDIIYDNNWDVQTPECSILSFIIDKHILFSISSGNVEPKHISLIEQKHSLFQANTPESYTIDYIVADVRHQKSVTLSARKQYMQLLRVWHQQAPLRMYIPFGENTFIRTAALLPGPFTPFKIKFARDRNQAFEIIRDDKFGVSTKKQIKQKNSAAPKQNQDNIEKLSAMIAGINWDEEGSIDSSFAVNEDDPFFILFESISLVKEELDSLIAERKKAEEALQNSNIQLQSALSELKQAQEKMVQQERSAAIGQLVAGIAHDFNNILSSILIYADILKLSPDTPTAMHPKLDIISDSGERAAHLVRQLLDFSRKTIRQPELLDLALFTKESVRFFERTIPENIQISFTLEPKNRYLIEADPTQLQQVITNLVINARDAMLVGGELRIGLSQVEYGENIECALCNQSMAGEWVQLKVMDTGCGILADVRPRIFEPFFTTKEIGNGTGLGLSQVAGIMAQHSGHVGFKSQVGQGATFTILFPVAVTLDKKSSKSELAQIKQGHSETILLVEDNPVVLDATMEMLEYLNYRVIPAANGLDALSAYQEHESEIALVLSDMVMPDMAGETLFHALKKENSGIRMILMSGYPLRAQSLSLLEQGVVTWVQKPISLGQLSHVVGNALSNKKGRWG